MRSRKFLVVILILCFTLPSGIVFGLSFGVPPVEARMRCLFDQGEIFKQPSFLMPYVCRVPTSDSGKLCKRSSECEDRCLVEMSADCTYESCPGYCAESTERDYSLYGQAVVYWIGSLLEPEHDHDITVHDIGVDT